MVIPMNCMEEEEVQNANNEEERTGNQHSVSVGENRRMSLLLVSIILITLSCSETEIEK